MGSFDLKTTIKKADLINDLRLQAKEHETAYNRAMINWRKAMCEAAQAVLKSGDTLDRYPKRLSELALTPVCYLKQIEDIISMLELSEEDAIVLSHDDFRRFVLGKDWSWSRNFHTTNSNYDAWDKAPPDDE